MEIRLAHVRYEPPRTWEVAVYVSGALDTDHMPRMRGQAAC
jgi:hypothetical protein